jgi:hypothetical protein
MLSLPPGGAAGTAIEGDLSQMSIATVLTVLEMERRTGTFEVVSKKRRAHLDIVSGNVIEGTVGGTKVSALAALRTMLAWHVGRFSFIPSALREVPSMGGNKTLGAFLIEALRLEDEATRAELELPPSRRRSPEARNEPRVAAPAWGGPASSPADFAPPSTRTPRPSELSLLLDPELAEWEIPAELASTEGHREPPRPHRAILPPPSAPAQPVTMGETPKPPLVEQTPPAGRAVLIPPTPRVNVPPPRPRQPSPPVPTPRPTPQVEKKRG